MAGAVVAAALVGGAPPVAAAPVPVLTFAAWNVCKLDCPSPAPSWDIRRDRVGRAITASGADVVAINEATNNQYGGRTQWDDIRALVADSGYVSPVIQDDVCGRSCENTARLLFKKSTVEQVDFGDRVPSAGSWPIGAIAPDIRSDSTRQVTWAYLKGRNGSGVFLAISAHLTNDKSGSGEQHRVAFGRALTGWANAMNAGRGLAGAPVVLMGDLNSFDARQPKGVQRVLRGAGWKDAHTAPKRRNIDIHTINYATVGSTGWPTKPIRNATGVASRIDYILYRGPVRATSYEVVVRLLPNGRYDPAFQASDHNMVRATLAYTAPVTAESGSIDPAALPAAAAPSPSPQQFFPAGMPLTERTMKIEQVVSWVANGYGSRMVSARIRSDGYVMQAFLEGQWVPVPYRNQAGFVSFSPKIYRAMGLSSDPLGSVPPPEGSMAWDVDG
jgi:endonuclease/exonuclease/phosphatase family metal-dependent hydrolase